LHLGELEALAARTGCDDPIALPRDAGAIVCRGEQPPLDFASGACARALGGGEGTHANLAAFHVPRPAQHVASRVALDTALGEFEPRSRPLVGIDHPFPPSPD